MENMIYLDGRLIGKNQKCYLIAEAGVNHNGNRQMMSQLIYEAKKAGAECIKFQTFQAESIVTQNAPKAPYQIINTGPKESQYEMLKKLELSFEDHLYLIEECQKLQISFLSTPYSLEDIKLLEELNVPFYKVASAMLVEGYFLEALAKTQKPVILSTGMCTLEEVKEAVETFKKAGGKQLILLQCTSNYPTPAQDAHLRVLQTFQKQFDLPVGFSDHCESHMPSVLSVAMGACVIEKHFTLDKTLPGPDHCCSLTPEEFKQLAEEISLASSYLGSCVKTPSKSERKNISCMRRQIVAKKPLKKGISIKMEDIAFKRPLGGTTPRDLPKVLGATLLHDMEKEEPFDLKKLEKTF